MTPRSWTFLTNHALVLAAVAVEPDARLQDISGRVGITERSTHGILKDLEDAGYVVITKVGRRNTYRVNDRLRLRHPMSRSTEIRQLLAVIGEG